jgi:transposase
MRRPRRNHSALLKAKVALAALKGDETTAVDLKALHAKIGQQALEIDFLAGALGRFPDPSAKR